MAKTKTDGGAAFPLAGGEGVDAPNSQFGMTLRDYFAAAALPAVMQARTALGNVDISEGQLDLSQESIAEECYELADALLEARHKQTEE